MKKLAFSILICLTALGVPLAAQTSLDTILGGLGISINPDSNAGQTTFPSLLVPMGGRNEGMATAFTAVANDSSFIESNPAASSLQGVTELAFFNNFWISNVIVDSVVYTQRIGDMGIAFSGKFLFVPFSQYSILSLVTTSFHYAETTLVANISYNFFSKYVWQGWDGIALGASVKVVMRQVPDYADVTGTLQPGSGASQSGIGIMVDVGLLTRFDLFKFFISRTKNLSIGITAKNLGFAVKGEALPTAFTFGIAYLPMKALTVSFDFTVPVNLLHPERSLQPYGALGILVNITDFVSAHMGLLIETGKPVITLGAHIDLDVAVVVVNYTLDSLTQLDTLNRFSFELKFDLGDQGRKAIQKKVEEYYFAGLQLYASGDIKGAIAMWDKCLELNPDFVPAQDSKATAQTDLELQQQMNEVQAIP